MDILLEVILKLSRIYIGAFEPVVRFSLDKFGHGEVARRIFSENQTIDERVKQLDVARENLIVGLNAIDELKRAAEKNKQELSEALEKLDALKFEKDTAEKQLAEIKTIAAADVTVFQKIAGVPTGKDKWIERSIGFVAGFFASLLASLAILPFI